MNKIWIFLIALLGLGPLWANIEVVEITPPTDFQSCDGAITVDASGEAGPFTVTITTDDGVEIYHQDGVNGEFSFLALCNGVYSVEVENGHECIHSIGPVKLRACVDPIIQAEVTFPNCGNNGEIELTVNEGHPDGQYQFSWVDGRGQTYPSKAHLTNLSAGAYSLTVTDLECQLSTTKSFPMLAVPNDFQVIVEEIVYFGPSDPPISVLFDPPISEV